MGRILIRVIVVVAANVFFNFGSHLSARETVAFSGNGSEPGTILVHTQERRLYLIIDNGRAL